MTGRHWALLLTLTGATLLMPLNSTMIAVAMRPILQHFHVDMAVGTWVVTVYLITMAAMQPVAGKLGDLYGYRRMLLGGATLFLGASVACLMAPSFFWLVVFRALQGLGGAIVSPNATAALRIAIPQSYHGRAFGAVGALMGYGAAAGPPLGGLLTGLFGWKSIFWVNVPLLLVVGALIFRLVPDAEGREGARFDLLGSLLLVIALVSTVLALTGVKQEANWVSQAASAALLSVGLFIRQETRHPEPLVNFRFFRNAGFAAANGSTLLQNLMMYTIMLLIPLFVQEQKGFTPGQSGLLLAVYSAMFALLAPVGGILVDRYGNRLPVTLSALLLGISSACLATAGAATPAWLIVLYLLVGGIGVGISGPAIQLAAIHSVPPSATGVASGVLTTSRYLGSITGSVVIGLVAGAALTEADYHWLFGALAGAGALLLLVSRGLPAQPLAAQPSAHQDVAE